ADSAIWSGCGTAASIRSAPGLAASDPVKTRARNCFACSVRSPATLPSHFLCVLRGLSISDCITKIKFRNRTVDASSEAGSADGRTLVSSKLSKTKPPSSDEILRRMPRDEGLRTSHTISTGKPFGHHGADASTKIAVHYATGFGFETRYLY